MNFAEAEFSTDGLNQPRPFVAPSNVARGSSFLNFHRENRHRIVASLCGRELAADQFYRFLVSQLAIKPGKPLICILYGGAEAGHNGFIQRLIEIGLREEIHCLFGAEQGSLQALTDLPWPAHDPLPERQDALLTTLFSTLNFSLHNDLTPNLLATLLRGAKQQAVVLHHIIVADRLDFVAKTLLKWYLSFWNEFPGAVNSSQIIVFLDFRNSAKDAKNPLVTWWRKRREKRDLRQIAELARKPTGDLPILFLGELPMVSRSEVGEWFRHYTDFSNSEIADRVNHIYPPLVTRLNMRAIELKLLDIPQEHFKEGAIDDVRKRFRALRRSWQHAGRT